MNEWLRIACSPTVVRRALRTALVVGALLIAINYGDSILRHRLSVASFFKMALTVVVPYLVSTASSVGAIRGQRPCADDPRDPPEAEG